MAAAPWQRIRRRGSPRAPGLARVAGLVACAAVLLSLLMRSPPATAALAAAPVIDPGKVVGLSDPGVELTPPADGRLRGDGIALIVTGGALTDRAGQGDQAISAGPGRHLIVFGLRQVPQPKIRDTPSASLALVVAGDRRSIDLSSLSGQGPWYFAASIPAGQTDVYLELSAAGFAQRFSLMTLTRPGPDPVALYRDPDNPAVVSTDTASIGVAATTVPPDGDSIRMLITAGTVTVSWFGPDAAIHTPASPDQAFLTVQAAENNDPQVGRPFRAAIPAAKVHLVLADGTRVDAAHTGDSTGLLSGTYYFVVPADTSTATLSVDAYSAPGTDFLASINNRITAATVALSAFTIPLALPKAPVPPPTTPVTVLKLTHASPVASGAAANPTAAHGPSAVPLGIVLILLAGAGALTWTTVHRRRSAAGRSTAPSGGLASPAPSPPTMAVPVGVEVSEGPSTSGPPASGPGDPSKPAWSSTVPGQPERPVAPTLTAPVAGEPLVTSMEIATASGAAPRPAAHVPTPVLVPIPVGAPEPPAGLLYFEVLGPLRVVGWPDDQARSVPVLDLATYLALHPGRAYTAEDLRDPLSIGKPRALEADTIRTYASTLRRAVGSDHLPDAGRRGYTLTAAGTDWHDFRGLTSAAATATEPVGQARLLAEALALVRGLPFAELPSSGFGWVATELYISQVEVAVTAAAQRLVELALAAGDWPMAAWAAERGLIVSPTAQTLNASVLRASAASRQPDRLAQSWRDVARRYAAAEETMPGELAQLHDDLRRWPPDAERDGPQRPDLGVDPNWQ